jgi:hypothetical protein
MNTIISTLSAVGMGVELAPQVERYFQNSLRELKVAASSVNVDYYKALLKELGECMARAPTVNEPYRVRIRQ